MTDPTVDDSIDDAIVTNGSKFECVDCKNEVEFEGIPEIGDVVECGFCGIEYEVTAKGDDGSTTLAIIEEEK